MSLFVADEAEIERRVEALLFAAAGPLVRASTALRIASSFISRKASRWAISSAGISPSILRSGLGSSRRDFR